MLDCTDFQPEVLPLGDSVKIVEKASLVCADDVVKVVQKKVGIRSSHFAERGKDLLVVQNLPVQVVDLGSLGFFGGSSFQGFCLLSCYLGLKFAIKSRNRGA